MIWKDEKIASVLKQNGVVVMPTDTIYGIVGRAFDNNVVERIYTTRQRSPEKPCVVLIGDIEDLAKFSINLSIEQREKIKEYWPLGIVEENRAEPVSLIFNCNDERFSYLHRGTHTLAFRLPSQMDLRDLLKETGPLVAPSANLEGMPPAINVDEAREYFGDKVDMYVDGGEIHGKASKILKLNTDGSLSVIRE